jgi:hypothetical protein
VNSPGEVASNAIGSPRTTDVVVSFEMVFGANVLLYTSVLMGNPVLSGVILWSEIVCTSSKLTLESNISEVYNCSVSLYFSYELLLLSDIDFVSDLL